MIQVFCDFDGTITNQDSIVYLTEQYGAGDAFRHSVIEKIKTGEITVFEAIRQEMYTVKLSWDEAVVALREAIQIDPAFPAFVGFCKKREFPLTVVSSGLEPVVGLYLEEFEIPFHAHPVEIDREGWKYERRSESEKTYILQLARKSSAPIVFVGDGASDVEAVPMVDTLFASKYLAQYCEERGIPFIPFRTFEDVEEKLEEMVLSGVFAD
jgi:2,3-diketo-5-methylthio-1-phosphopentane phosphatase